MRQWIGGSLSLLVGVAVSLWSVVKDMPMWVVVVVVVLTMAAVALQVPAWKASEPTRTVTFKGNVTNSRLNGIYSDADTLVEGDVYESLLNRIRHRPKESGGRS